MNLRRKIISTMFVTSVVSTLLSGCSLAIKRGASTGIGFTEKHILPPILMMSDTDMVCNSSNALAPLIMATQEMGADPTRIAVLLYSAAGMCAENQALNAELRYLRAAKIGQMTEAQDARIEQKRWAALAAKRQYIAYQMIEKHWKMKFQNQLGEGCPKMNNALDQTVYLLGMLSGVQAMTNDVASAGQAHIPKDIAAIVERGMTCLDDTRYWGVPNATRAAIWTLLPGAGEGKADPDQTLRHAMQIGESKGVRLAHALNAIAAQASGDDVKIRDALRRFAASNQDDTVNNVEFRLMDAMAGQMVQNIADRYWTEHTGMRAAEEGMSQFWDDQAISEDDELFNIIPEKPAS